MQRGLERVALGREREGRSEPDGEESLQDITTRRADGNESFPTRLIYRIMYFPLFERRSIELFPRQPLAGYTRPRLIKAHCIGSTVAEKLTSRVLLSIRRGTGSKGSRGIPTERC